MSLIYISTLMMIWNDFVLWSFDVLYEIFFLKSLKLRGEVQHLREGCISPIHSTSLFNLYFLTLILLRPLVGVWKSMFVTNIFGNITVGKNARTSKTKMYKQKIDELSIITIRYMHKAKKTTPVPNLFLK